MRPSPDAAPVRVAARLCAMMLAAYPKGFRRLHGREIEKDTATLVRVTYERAGVRGLMWLLIRNLIDTARVAVREHRWARAETKRAARLRRWQPKRQSEGRSRGEFMGTIIADIRYALRTLAKQPGFTAATVVTLALGIGANTAIFSVINGVLLQPLPYTDGSRLMVLQQQGDPNGRPSFSPLEVQDYREQVTTLEQVVEYHSLDFNLLGRGEPERVRSGVVSWNFFQTLGVRPLLGRVFVPEDDVMGADPVLVLSHRYWSTSFGADSAVIGETVEMNDHVHTIVGVLPPVPHYPRENDVYMPTVACPFRSGSWADNRSARGLRAFARVRQDVTREALSAELTTVARNIREAHPEHYTQYRGHGIATLPLKEELTNTARPTLFILMGTVGLVLLIACANVANLMLSRLFQRERELAVRTALGAGKARLARQLITESIVLTVAGGALGLMVAAGGLDLLIGFTERFTTRAREIQIDGWVLFFTIGLSVATGLVFGALPALPRGHSLGEALKDGAGHSTTDAGKLRLRGALVVAQLAVAFMVLIGAGLVVRSLWKLQHVDPGFDGSNVLTMTLATPFNFDRDPAVFKDQVLERVRAVPGVTTAALTSSIPLGAGPFSSQFDIVGRPAPTEDERPGANFRFATPGYFETIKQPLIRGRTFRNSDRRDAPLVVVINQSLARNHFAGEDPLGQVIVIPNLYGDEPVTIVGVVGDVRQELDAEVGDDIYLSLLAAPFVFSRIVAATEADPGSLVMPITAAVHAVAPEVPLTDVRTFEDVRRNSLASPRLTAMLLATFAALALVITATGVAAVIGFSVNQRVHEIGVRMALGARRESVLAMVLGQGMRLVLVGLLLGTAGAVALTRAMSGLLFGVGATDALTFATVGVLLAGVAALAAIIPARRATAIDPMVALRAE